ncbi:hypothetical protein EON65_20670, partial [archaeon]
MRVYVAIFFLMLCGVSSWYLHQSKRHPKLVLSMQIIGFGPEYAAQLAQIKSRKSINSEPKPEIAGRKFNRSKKPDEMPRENITKLENELKQMYFGTKVKQEVAKDETQVRETRKIRQERHRSPYAQVMEAMDKSKRARGDVDTNDGCLNEEDDYDDEYGEDGSYYDENEKSIPNKSVRSHPQ